MLRYWDGNRWTESWQPAVQSPTQPQQPQRRSLLAYFLIAWVVLAAAVTVTDVIAARELANGLDSEGNPFAGPALQARLVADAGYTVLAAGVITGLEAWGRSVRPGAFTRTVTRFGQAMVVGFTVLMLVLTLVWPEGPGP